MTGAAELMTGDPRLYNFLPGLSRLFLISVENDWVLSHDVTFTHTHTHTHRHTHTDTHTHIHTHTTTTTVDQDEVSFLIFFAAADFL